MNLARRIVDFILEDDAEDFVSSFASAEDREGGRPLTVTPEDKEVVRAVRFHTGHILVLWDTHHRRDYGQVVLGYRFLTPDGKVLFQGEDFSPGAVRDPYGDSTVASIMGYITLKPGDTDEQYFEKYTPEQLAWTESSECEELSGSVSDFEASDEDAAEYGPDFQKVQWRDLPGHEYQGDEP